MADELILSYWLRGYTPANMLRHWERVLKAFPFSRLSPNAALRVHAVEYGEPPVLERLFAVPFAAEDVIAAAAEFLNPDCACRLECAWDLWQFDQDWALKPARVSLWCFGELFPNDDGDHLRLELGPDFRFVPAPGLPQSLRMVRSNIVSLLRLSHELDNVLAVERRRLWSETGEDFSARLQLALEQAD